MAQTMQEDGKGNNCPLEIQGSAEVGFWRARQLPGPRSAPSKMDFWACRASTTEIQGPYQGFAKLAVSLTAGCLPPRPRA
jgi:hypothetical protein